MPKRNSASANTTVRPKCIASSTRNRSPNRRTCVPTSPFAWDTAISAPATRHAPSAPIRMRCATTIRTVCSSFTSDKHIKKTDDMAMPSNTTVRIWHSIRPTHAPPTASQDAKWQPDGANDRHSIRWYGWISLTHAAANSAPCSTAKSTTSFISARRAGLYTKTPSTVSPD